MKELEGKLDFQDVPILKIRYVYLLKTSVEHLNNKHLLIYILQFHSL